VSGESAVRAASYPRAAVETDETEPVIVHGVRVVLGVEGCQRKTLGEAANRDPRVVDRCGSAAPLTRSRQPALGVDLCVRPCPDGPHFAYLHGLFISDPIDDASGVSTDDELAETGQFAAERIAGLGVECSLRPLRPDAAG
jgi:hypothetical protein